MNTKIYTSIAIILLALAGIGWFMYSSGGGVSVLGEYVTGGNEVEQESAGETQTYTNQSPEFSFEYPAGFTVTSFAEGTGEVVLVQSRDNQAVGMQVYFTSFDEEGPLTVERIKEDLPNLEMNNAREADLFPDTLAVVFRDGSGMVNVWFVRGGYMYQITAAPELGGLFQTMVGSLRF
ncbi:MAG: hypothetical protein WD003_00255 [Candidatus Paceibacterota bacterium]